MKTVILILVTISLLACTKNTDQQKVAPIKVNEIYALPQASKKNINLHHTLIGYKQSACKANTFQSDKILHQELHADTLILKIRSLQNCDAKYNGNFNFADNHLNLSLQLQPKIVTRKNGETDTIYSLHECDCMYEFTYTINRVHALPQIVT